MKPPVPMTTREIEDEAAFAQQIYKDRARVNRKALEVMAAMPIPAGSSQITIRLDNKEIALARQQAEAKGLKYQTYIKMLLHQALHHGLLLVVASTAAFVWT